MAITLLITDENLTVQGDPLAGWTGLSCDLNFNEPATGQVTLPARPEYMAQLQPGNRLVLIRNGSIWCAGPLEQPQDLTWDVQQQPTPGQVTVSFSDDLARIAGYLTYPNPAAAFGSQTTTSDTTYSVSATNAETIIRNLINLNCGPGAIAARQIPQLVLDSVAGVGTNTAITTRFEPLLDAARTVAAHDGLGFRTRQVGTAIKFGVYQPADRRATARFSEGLGNLRGGHYTLAAPTATSALVQGGSTGSRAYVEVTSGEDTTWYRVEKLVDQTGTTNANGELTQAGAKTFTTDAAKTSLSTVTVDTPDLQAGRDYGLGDLVTVVLPTGVEVADIVRTIRLEADEHAAELVTSVIGTGDQTTAAATQRVLADLGRRVARLEARR